MIAKSLPPRLGSIDVFRALTMFLMIFVNDLWTLQGVPKWLEHTSAQEDGMGLSDVVFPAFLFIVGLSIPFALSSRINKGYSTSQTVFYILLRSFALLLMGFFHVNLESYGETSLLPKPIFQILITLAFFLIWLDYAPRLSQKLKITLQSVGVLLLVVLAATYRSSDGGWMKPHWWGILGMIGWSYLLCSLITLFSRERLTMVTGAFIFFLLFNVAAHAEYFSAIGISSDYVWIIGDGAMPAMTIAGVLCSVVYKRHWANNRSKKFYAFLAVLSVVMFGFGFGLRPLFIISKILATPSWVMICIGISLLLFLLLVWLIDVEKKKDWFKLIRPAGTSTLTCYLIPYIHYALYSIIGYSLPLYLRTGLIGIIKSLLYSLAVILLVGLLERCRLRLKL